MKNIKIKVATYVSKYERLVKLIAPNVIVFVENALHYKLFILL
jgi:hypothetical protein